MKVEYQYETHFKLMYDEAGLMINYVQNLINHIEY
jgi:hypothetical protein